MTSTALPLAAHGLRTEVRYLGKVVTVHEYNATSIGRNADGKDVAHELVQVGLDGKVYRSCGCQSYESGTAAFDAMYRAKTASRAAFGLTYRIERDGGEAYVRAAAPILGEHGINELKRAG